MQIGIYRGHLMTEFVERCKKLREIAVTHLNYDEEKVGPYTLEDPLKFADGTPLRDPSEWPRRRREILDIFAHEMYGEEPPAPSCLITELVEQKENALAGFAVRSQYKMWFKEDKSGPCINWMLHRPRYAKGPVPVIILLNYYGNFTLVTDKDIPVMTAWANLDAKVTENYHIMPSARGYRCDSDSTVIFPISLLIARGYAVLTACYAEVSPDPAFNEKDPEYTQEKFPYTGVFSLWGERDETRQDNTTSLGAWAWALSRGLDLAERIPELDAKRNIVTGFSRLGKSALLAAARDERFGICVANQCGGGGVTLAKRKFGESIETETSSFTHWYCKAYAKYAEDPARLLPFDQHLLVASIAPRKLLVEGFNAPWFDTKGEFLSCQAASPVWEFLGKPGLPKVAYPDIFDTSAIGPYLGYVRREEDHGLAAPDWCWLLDFTRELVK